MSGRVRQETVDGEVYEHGEHLTKNGNYCQEPIRKSREFVCLDCMSRVTQSLDRSVEWGHETDCEHHATLGGGQ